jgi:hypothetical protein
MDALDEGDDAMLAGVLAEGLEAQRWGPSGLDPIDELAFSKALAIVGSLDPETVREALGLLPQRVPREAARHLLEGAEQPTAFPAAPRVRLLVKAPEAGGLYPVRVLVEAAGAARVRIDPDLPGVDRVVPHGLSERPLRNGKAAVEFGVRTGGGAHRVVGSLRVTLWDRESERIRVYHAPFRYEVDGTHPVVTRYEIHNEGVLRWNQHLLPADTLPERDAIPGPGRGASPPPPEDLFVVPNLAATAAAEVDAWLAAHSGPDAWQRPAAVRVHNAIFAWRDGSGDLHAGVVVGEDQVTLGRHHRKADIPVRIRADVGNLEISRSAAEVRWVGELPRLHRTGDSPLLLEGEPMLPDRGAVLTEQGQEVTWLGRPPLRWEIRVLRASGERRPVRWHEPAHGGAGRLCHVVAPGGGRLGGPAPGSLLPLPNGSEQGPGVELHRRDGGWWLAGVECVGGPGRRAVPPLLVDGRPCRHPHQRYGLRDGARIQLPCGTELEFYVGRSKGPPDGDWEIRDRLVGEGPLHHLADLLSHVVHQ